MAKNGYGTISANGTIVIYARDAIVAKAVSFTGAGTVDIYDVAVAGSVTASKQVHRVVLSTSTNTEINIPCMTGITVVATGIAGTSILTWSKP